MYMQFMVPTNWRKDTSIGLVFKESFLNVVKDRGLEEAVKTFDEATKTWDKGSDLAPKGMDVSDDGAYDKWSPFGPAIKGYYDDYGNMRPAEDEETQRRVAILSGLMGGLSFDTIMGVAQDDRWFTYGLGNNDKYWLLDGVSSDMPEWLLILCKNLSLTYFHAGVYEEMAKFDFSPSEKGGVLTNSYEKKWKTEWIEEIREGLPQYLEGFKIQFEEPPADETVEEAKIKLKIMVMSRDLLHGRLGPLQKPSHKIRDIYQACLVRETPDLEWLYESMQFMWSLSRLNIQLDRTKYGSQETNWNGWNRVHAALAPTISEFQRDFEEEE